MTEPRRRREIFQEITRFHRNLVFAIRKRRAHEARLVSPKQGLDPPIWCRHGAVSPILEHWCGYVKPRYCTKSLVLIVCGWATLLPHTELVHSVDCARTEVGLSVVVCTCCGVLWWALVVVCMLLSARAVVWCTRLSCCWPVVTAHDVEVHTFELLSACCYRT